MPSRVDGKRMQQNERLELIVGISAIVTVHGKRERERESWTKERRWGGSWVVPSDVCKWLGKAATPNSCDTGSYSQNNTPGRSAESRLSWSLGCVSHRLVYITRRVCVQRSLKERADDEKPFILSPEFFASAAISIEFIIFHQLNFVIPCKFL